MDAGLDPLREFAPNINPAMVQGYAFVLFSLASILMMAGLTAQTSVFKLADLDVLFPTPVSSKVILSLRMIRNTLSWLLLPIVVFLFTAGPTLATVNALRASPVENLGAATQIAFLCYLLMAGIFSFLSYGVSLWLSRPVRESDRNRKIINTVLLLLGLSPFLYFGIGFYLNPAPETIPNLASAPVVRALFPIAELSSQAIMAPVTGKPLLALSLVVLVGLMVLAFRFALSQSRYLYELAASTSAALGEMSDVAKTGNMAALQAIQARQGRIKAKNSKLLSQWQARGIWAFVWRDLVEKIRTRSWVLAALILMPSLMIYLTFWFVDSGIATPSTAGRTTRITQMSLLFSPAALIMMGTQTGQQVLFNLLKRVDLLKPLPFNAYQLVMADVLSTLSFAVLCSLPAFLFTVIAGISQLPLILSCWILAWMLLAMNYSIGCIANLLFPDIEDATQSGIRSLVYLIGFMTLIILPIGAFVGLHVALKWHPFIALWPSAIMIAVVVFFGLQLAGRLYRNFDPRE